MDGWIAGRRGRVGGRHQEAVPTARYGASIKWPLITIIDSGIDDELMLIHSVVRSLFMRACVALQLHPDKNRHPKAEVAFKIVSEVLVRVLFLSSLLHPYAC